MIDHITLYVKHLDKSKRFYDKVMKSLGLKIVLGGKKEKFYGYGVSQDPCFEIAQSTKSHPAHQAIHIAFKAKNAQTVDRFYKEAIKAGGADNGKPGLRTQYTPTYYAAFVRDPDWNNLEAVFYQ